MSNSPNNKNHSPLSIEYPYNDVLWICRAPEVVRGYFGIVDADGLTQLHTLAFSHESYRAAWEVLWRIAGLTQVISTKEEPIRTITQAATEMGTSPELADVYLSVLVNGWDRLGDEQMLPQAPAPKPEYASEAEETAELSKEENNLLLRYGFTHELFQLAPQRDEAIVREEKRWFVQRLGELQKVFDEPMAKSLARQALHNELQLRRIDDLAVTLPLASEQFGEIQKMKRSIETAYSKQWTQLEEICPYIRMAKNKTSIQGVFSELVQGWLEYKAEKTHKIFDGIFTALEIQVLMRPSEQMAMQLGEGEIPNQYRPEWVVAANESRHGMADPKFESSFPLWARKTIREVWKAAWNGIAARLVKPVDLESGGPVGEFENLKLEYTDAEHSADPNPNLN